MSDYRIAFAQLKKNIGILIMPVMLDLLSLGLGWAMTGFNGTPRFSVRAILEIGLPSVSHVLTVPQAVNTTEFLKIPSAHPIYTGIVVACMLLLTAYMQGVYILGLLRIAKQKPVEWRGMMKRGRSFLLRFLFLGIIVFFAKIAVTAILVLSFQMIGAFVSFVFFVFLRTVLIYFEFTIVADNVNIDTAFRRSVKYFRASVPRSMLMIAVLYAVTGVISGLIHRFLSPGTIIIGVFVYAAAMTWMQLAMMQHLLLIRDEATPARKAA